MICLPLLKNFLLKNYYHPVELVFYGSPSRKHWDCGRITHIVRKVLQNRGRVEVWKLGVPHWQLLA